jgi:hypothetical protein
MFSYRKSRFLFGVIGLLSVIGVLSPTKTLADNPIAGNYLLPGDFLRPLELIFSPNGLYFLQYQSDGNLVIRQCSIAFCVPPSTFTVTWQSGTSGNTPGIFNVDPRDGYIHVWSIDSSGKYVESAWFGSARCGGNYLKLQDDGNLVLYRVNPPYGETAWSAEWASNSSVGWPPSCP